ncbi:MAG: hypothetical protein V4735_04445 [Pseudomonadota bacterium]
MPVTDPSAPMNEQAAAAAEPQTQPTTLAPMIEDEFEEEPGQCCGCSNHQHR